MPRAVLLVALASCFTGMALYAESVRGAINRDGDKALVAGEVDEGDFSLEESVDGVRISATWTGTVIDGSCGREIRGDWQSATGGGTRNFVLRKR